MLAKLTVAGNLEEARMAIAKWLWMCDDLMVLDEEECSCFGPAHTHLTVAIPCDLANEAAHALVQWANDTSGCKLLFYDGELKWPDETDDA